MKAVVQKIFSDEDFKECSFSGKRGHGKPLAKPQLDPRRQKAVKGKSLNCIVDFQANIQKRSILIF